MYDVKLRCLHCGEHNFSVRFRRPDEDIVTFLRGVIEPAMGIAHRAASPDCPAETCDLMLPLNEAVEGIGMETKQ